jgi:hypothetical protein
MKYKIYTLKNPTTNEIRYVGFTSAKSVDIRLNSHIYEAKNTRVTTKNSSWIKSLLKKGIKPKIELLDEVNDNWQFWEQYWISQFKSWEFKLNNHTLGGEGNLGYKPTEKTLSKIRKIYCKYDLNGNFIKKYKSITEAAKDNNTQISIINQAAKVKTISKGYQWRYYNKNYKNNIGIVTGKLQNVKIEQYSLNGDFIKEWDSVKEASKILVINSVNIIKVLKQNRKTAGNFQWKYTFNNVKIEKVEITSGFKKQIIQMDKNKNIINIFNSLMEAETKTGISNKNISNVIRHKTVTAGGYLWEII